MPDVEAVLATLEDYAKAYCAKETSPDLFRQVPSSGRSQSSGEQSR